jgi:DNA polymerase
MATPWFSKDNKYVAIGEAPGQNEALRETPWVGPAGKILWEALKEFDFDLQRDFALINSVQCRPVVEERNGKPSDLQMKMCKFNIEKFIDIVKPQKIIILGSYAREQLLGPSDVGITKANATKTKVMGIPAVISVHPAYCIYHGEEAREMLRNSVKIFKEIK